MKLKSLILLLIPFVMIGCTTNKKPNSQSDINSDSHNSSETSSDVVSSEESSESESSSSSEEPPIEVPSYDYDGYYANLSWNNSEDLINKLHTIISQNFTSLRYEGNWATNQGADQAIDDFESVDVVYSSENQLKTKTYSSGQGWQREHAFAASLMTGFTSSDAVGVHQGRATDFHNLFAANNSGNSSRGNKNFGVANTEDETYQDFGAYTFDSRNFEPANEDKGKLSRAIFYMAVMYNQPEQETVKVTLNYNDEDKVTFGKNTTSVSINVTYSPLTIIEDYVPYSKFTYTNWYYYGYYANPDNRPDKMDETVYETLCDLVDEYGEGPEGYAAYSMANCQFAIGNLSTLLDWNNYDVDMLEMQHNQYVYSESGQGNRNPFVDYPELVSYCFGEKKNQAGSLEDLEASYYTLKMDKDEIHHYAISKAKREYDEGSTFSSSDYVIKGVKNDLSVVDASYQDTTEDYVFTAQDAANKTKELTITTPINNIKFKVAVNSGSIDSCSYQGLFLTKTKNDFTNGGTTEVCGVNWKTTWTNTNGAMYQRDATYGIGFGTSSKPMNELTLQTTTSYQIDKIYFKGTCKSGGTINVTIKVGNETVLTDTITRVAGATGPEVVGKGISSATGIITIIINGPAASNGSIYVHTIAFNAQPISSLN